VAGEEKGGRLHSASAEKSRKKEKGRRGSAWRATKSFETGKDIGIHFNSRVGEVKKKGTFGKVGEGFEP